MSVRTVFIASVSSALLVALAAVPVTHAAPPATPSAAETADQAWAALSQGNAPLAISEFTTAIDSGALPPEAMATALVNRGLAFQQGQAYDKAVEDYSAALRISALAPKLRATALFNRGLAYQKLKEPSLSAEDFTNALLLDPTFSHCYFARANVLRENGQYLYALADYGRARANKYPYGAPLAMGEAMTYQAMGQEERAEASAREALASKSDYAPALAMLHLPASAVTTAAATPAPVLPATTALQAPVAVAMTEAATAPATAQAAPAPDMRVARIIPTSAPGVAQSRKLYSDRLPQDTSLMHTATALTAKRAAPQDLITTGSVSQVARPAAKVAALAPPSLAEEETVQTATTEASAAPAVSAEPQGWSVQLSSATEEAQAWKSWKKLENRSKSLSGQKPVVVKADLGVKGVFYRLRLAGFETRGDAQSLCSRLKSSGISCFISRAKT